MPTSKELRAQLEDTILRYNACKSALKDFRQDRDHPHTNQKLLADADKRVAELDELARSARDARDKLAARLDTIILDSRIEMLNGEACDLRERMTQLNHDILDTEIAEAAAKPIQQQLAKVDKLTEQLRTLPQSELQALLAKFFPPVDIEKPAEM